MYTDANMKCVTILVTPAAPGTIINGLKEYLKAM
jgi:hypothetical protein